MLQYLTSKAARSPSSPQFAQNKVLHTARYDVAASGGGGGAALSANVVSSEKNQLRLFASSSQIRILTDGCLGLLNVYSTLRAWLCFV